VTGGEQYPLPVGRFYLRRRALRTLIRRRLGLDKDEIDVRDLIGLALDYVATVEEHRD